MTKHLVVIFPLCYYPKMSEAPHWQPDRHSFIPDEQPLSTADNVALIGLCLAGTAVLKGIEVVNRVVDQVQSKKAAVKRGLVRAIDPFYH